MDPLPRPNAYDRGNGTAGWYTNQKVGWENLLYRINSIEDNAQSLVQPKVEVKRVLLALETEGGALIEGAPHGQGGIGATAEDVRVLSKYWEDEVQNLQPLREALRLWTAVLIKYPTPRFILRTSKGRWARATGLGFSTIAGPAPLPWLDAQTQAFSNLITYLDVVSEDTQADPRICQAAISIACAFTKPGGATLLGVATWHAEAPPRQAPIGGPGAHYLDVTDIYLSHSCGYTVGAPDLYDDYLETLRHPEMPFYIVASSPGLHARQRWSWYQPQWNLYQTLIRDIMLYTRRRTSQRLLGKLQDKEGGILIQGVPRQPAGGPGAHWLDVRDLLQSEGYDPARSTDRWVTTATSYLELLKKDWPTIPVDIRATGFGYHAVNLDDHAMDLDD